jgi:hypothetical protein
VPVVVQRRFHGTSRPMAIEVAKAAAMVMENEEERGKVGLAIMIVSWVNLASVKSRCCWGVMSVGTAAAVL